MARRKRRAEIPKAELNLTAMMDLVLNLVTFFVMVCNFSMAAMPPLTPPQPTRSLAKPSEAEDKIWVSLQAEEDNSGRIRRVVVGQEEVPVGQMDKVTALLQKEVGLSSTVEIHLRADQSLRFVEVEPYMLAIAGAGVQQVHYVAVPQD